MFSATLARRFAGATTQAASAAQHTPKLYISQYKPKKVWPPDYTKLTPQAQLKFEKKYKRRIALLSERPQWNKFVKLAQIFSITFVLGYSVLFMDWEDERYNPFFEIKKSFWEFFGVPVELGAKVPMKGTTPRPEFNKNPR